MRQTLPAAEISNLISPAQYKTARRDGNFLFQPGTNDENEIRGGTLLSTDQYQVGFGRPNDQCGFRRARGKNIPSGADRISGPSGYFQQCVVTGPRQL